MAKNKTSTNTENTNTTANCTAEEMRVVSGRKTRLSKRQKESFDAIILGIKNAAKKGDFVYDHYFPADYFSKKTSYMEKVMHLCGISRKLRALGYEADVDVGQPKSRVFREPSVSVSW